MDKITATFPRINLTAAVMEVKDDNPSNAELLSLRIPDFVDGDPDVLMCIFYESCHPIKVHTLPPGLFIGKLQLAHIWGNSRVRQSEVQWVGLLCDYGVPFSQVSMLPKGVRLS